ncbi:MAG: lectin subunit alpha [Prochlorococcus sp. SP3034]|nr:lectin subunit alpha [Prochlorococcus sp. SP3034]
MDPLDPLTEIVRSGQAFSLFIIIERLIWIMIGAFFLGAISTGIRNGMKDQGWFGNKSFLIGINTKKNKEDNENSNKIEDKNLKNRDNI